MDSYDESVHRRYSSSAVDRYPTVQWFYDSFEPNFESTIASSAAAATTTIDASQIMHSTTTAAAVNPNFSSPDIPAAATAAVTKNKRKKSQKRKKEHREVRTSTSAASKNKRLIKEVNRDSTVALRQKETAITSVATATAANDTTLTNFFNFGNVKPAETANVATKTSYTSSTDSPNLIDQLMNSYDDVVHSYSTTNDHPSVQSFYQTFGKDTEPTATTNTAFIDGDLASQQIIIHDITAASNTVAAAAAASSSFPFHANEDATVAVATASTATTADIATSIENKSRETKKRKQNLKPLTVSRKKKPKKEEIQFSIESAAAATTTTTTTNNNIPGVIACIKGNDMPVLTDTVSSISSIFPPQIANSTQPFPAYSFHNNDIHEMAETAPTTMTASTTTAATTTTTLCSPSSSPSSSCSMSEAAAAIEAAIAGDATVISSGDISTSNNNNINNRRRLDSLNEHKITLCKWKTLIKNQNPILPDIHIVQTVDGSDSFDLYFCYDYPNRVMYLALPITLRARGSKLKQTIRDIASLITSELLYSITILHRPCSLEELKSAFLKLTADEPSNQHMLCLQRNVPYPYEIL